MIDPKPSSPRPSHRYDGSGRTKKSSAEISASVQVSPRSTVTVRPLRSTVCPSTGAANATTRPAIVVDTDRACEVWLVLPNDELVR